MRRNVSGQVVGVQLVSKTDGSAVTSGTTTVYVTGDAGTQAVGSVGSGACTHEGQGFWTYAPAQAETNYPHVAFTFVNTSAVNATVQVYPTAYDANGRVDVGAIGGTAQTARDIGASVLLSSGTGAGQISLTSGLVTLAGVTHTGAVIPTVTTLTNLPSIPANWLTAAGIAASALNGKGDWNVGKTGYSLTAGTGLGNQTADITGNLSGSVGSVTGAVGSVTTAVTLPSIPAGWITAAGIAADAIDAIWDEQISGHLAAGSTGNALNAAGSSGDPWSTSLPGAYGSGTAGKIIGDNLNATVGSRATQTSVDTIDGIVDDILVDTAVIGAAGAGLSAIPWNAAWDAEVQSEAADALAAYDPPTHAELTSSLAAADDAVLAIIGTPAGASLAADVAAVKAQTGAIEVDTQDIQTRLPAALVSGRIDASVGAMAAEVMTAAAAAADLTTELQSGLATAAALSTVAGYLDTEVAAILAAVDTEVAAIKAKTDNLPAAPAATGDIPSAGAIADAVLDEVVEGSVTLRQSVRLANAALGGKASGLDTTNPKYRDLADTKDRIDATVDANGNRSAVTRDLT